MASGCCLSVDRRRCPTQNSNSLSASPGCSGLQTRVPNKWLIVTSGLKLRDESVVGEKFYGLKLQLIKVFWLSVKLSYGRRTLWRKCVRREDYSARNMCKWEIFLYCQIYCFVFKISVKELYPAISWQLQETTCSFKSQPHSPRDHNEQLKWYIAWKYSLPVGKCFFKEFMNSPVPQNYRLSLGSDKLCAGSTNTILK